MQDKPQEQHQLQRAEKIPLKRQYKALMAKNYNLWKATRCGCCMEICLSIIISFFINSMLQMGDRTVLPNTQDPNNLRAPFFNPLEYLGENNTISDDEWEFSIYGSKRFEKNNAEFMTWANFTNDFANSSYDPFMDFRSPTYFHPMPCLAQEVFPLPIRFLDNGEDKRQKPVIAYIKNGNQIEEDLLNVLKTVLSIKSGVSDLFDVLKEVALGFGFDVDSVLSGGSSDESESTEADTSSEGGESEEAVDGAEEEEESAGPSIDITMFFADMDWQFVEFDSYDDIKAYMQADDYMEDTRPGICFGFSVDQVSDNKFDIDLMFNDQNIFDRFSNMGMQIREPWDPVRFQAYIGEYFQYTSYGFAFLQNWIADLILKRQSGNMEASIVNLVVPFKGHEVIINPKRGTFQNILPTQILYLFIPLLYRTTYLLGRERQAGTKDLLLKSGVNRPMYKLTWYGFFMLTNAFICFITTLVLSMGPFEHSSRILMFLDIWLYAMSIYPIAWLCSTLIHDPYVAAIFAILVHYGQVYSAKFAQTNQFELSISQKSLMALFIPYAGFHSNNFTFAWFEAQGYGITWNSYDVFWNEWTFKRGLIMMTFSNILWYVISVLWDNFYVPYEGKNEKDRTCNCYKFKMVIANCRAKKQVKKEEIQEEQKQPKNDEQMDEMCKLLGVQNLEAGQIYGLVGPYGSGKTVLLEKIVQLLGKHQAKIVDEVHSLYDYMIGSQHLSFLQQMLGDQATGSVAPDYLENFKISKQLRVIDMQPAEAKKLQIALGFCLPSQVLLMDEPSRKLNLQQKQEIYQLVKKYKGSKIIIWATTSYNEAIQLCDVVGLVNDKQVKRVGTPQELNSQLGLNYKLTVNKTNQCSPQLINKFLDDNLGSKHYRCLNKDESQNGKAVVYQVAQLSLEIVGNLLTNLDKAKDELGFDSYKLTILDAEDAFAQVNYQELLDDSSINYVSQNYKSINYDKERKPDDESWSSGSFTKDSANVDTDTKQKQIIQTVKEQLQDLEEPKMDQNLYDSAKNCIQNENEKSENLNATSDQLNKANSNMSRSQVKKKLCIQQIFSVIKSNFISYCRNRKNCMFDIIIPVVFIAILVTFVNVMYLRDPPSRQLTPDTYPFDSPILFVNEEMINEQASNVEVYELMDTLPDAERWDIEYFDESDYYSFQGKCYSQKPDMDPDNVYAPLLYGSYQIYSANTETQQYKYITYMNMSSSEAVPNFQNYMYESVLRTALDDPEFEFNVNNRPLPLKSNWRLRGPLHKYDQINQVMSFALSMFMIRSLYKIISKKHTQKVYEYLNGLNLTTYWFSHWIADVVKLEIILIFAGLIFKPFEMGYEDMMPVFALFPVAFVTYLYAFTAPFKRPINGLMAVIIIHVFVINIGDQVNIVFRFIKGTDDTSLMIANIFKLAPSYVLSWNYWINGGVPAIIGLITLIRGFEEPDWIQDYKNDPRGLQTDVRILLLHTLVWLIVLILVESNCIRKCQRCCQKSKNQNSKNADYQNVNKVANDTSKLEFVNLEFNRENAPIVASVKQVTKKIKRKNRGCFNCCPCYKSFKQTYLDKVSLDLHQGECLAILAEPGTGKTEAFKQLAIEIRETNKEYMGVAFQQPHLDQQLTVRQTIEYFTKLTGYENKANLDQIVQNALKRACLEQKSGVRLNKLSEGEIRRLQLAISMLKDYKVIMLDDPLDGLSNEDANIASKMIQDLVQTGNSGVIITTSSAVDAQRLSANSHAILSKDGKLTYITQNEQSVFSNDNSIVFEMIFNEPSANKIVRMNEKVFGIKNPLKFIQEDADGNKITVIPNISLNDALVKVRNYKPEILNLFEKLLISEFLQTNSSSKVSDSTPIDNEQAKNNSQIEMPKFLRLVYILDTLLAICTDIMQRFGGRVQLIAPFASNQQSYILYIANDFKNSLLPVKSDNSSQLVDAEPKKKSKCKCLSKKANKVETKPVQREFGKEDGEDKPVLTLTEVMSMYSSTKQLKPLRNLKQLKIGQVDIQPIYKHSLMHSQVIDLKFAKKLDDEEKNDQIL